MRKAFHKAPGARPTRLGLKGSIVVACLTTLAATHPVASQSAWNWTGSFSDDAVDLLFLGDIQVFRADPATAFKLMRETLQAADLVYANYEGLLVKSRCVGCTREFRRRNPDEVAGTIDIPGKEDWVHPGAEGVLGLKAANVAVVGIANNVAYGRENIRQTMRVLDANGILYTGGGRNYEEAHAPAIVERQGVRFGFLQYTGRNYDPAETFATADKPGIARMQSLDGITIDPFDLDRLRYDVRKLRPQVDIVVVSQHNRRGGTRTQFGEVEIRRKNRERHPAGREPYQELFAREALDAGADIVVGHGNHSLDGVGIYDGKPIVYNTAHSNFDQPGYENAKEGIVLRIVVDGPLGSKIIQRVSFVPVWRDDNNDVMLMDPTVGRGAELLEKMRSLSPDVPLRIDGKEVVFFEGEAVTRGAARAAGAESIR